MGRQNRGQQGHEHNEGEDDTADHETLVPQHLTPDQLPGCGKDDFFKRAGNLSHRILI
jgi:hypothetical protein